MSNLQFGLVVIGALVLLGLVVHSAWSARANAPRQPEPVGVPPESEAAVQEPSLDDEGFDAMRLSHPMARRPAIDALIDAIAAVNLDPLATAVSGEAAMAAFPSTRRAGTKLFSIEGFNVETQEWESPAAGARYHVFQTGVQLANRSGPLNDIEYSEFVMKTQAFADALGATPEFPEMRDEVARARELDNFASAHDAQLGLNLRVRQAAWSPGYVVQMAAQQGFVAGQLPGRMVMAGGADGLPPLLSLTFDSQAVLAEDPDKTAIYELVLHLDVPQVDRADQPFDRMCHAAQAMAQSMDGVVTDDNGQALSPQALQTISQELHRLYDMLEQRDFAAGSALARRLFS